MGVARRDQNRREAWVGIEKVNEKEKRREWRAG